MVPNAVFYLADRISFHEFVAIAPELIWPDVFHNLGLVTAKYRSILVHLNVNSELFTSILIRTRIDEGKELADAVTVSYNIYRTDIE